MAQSDTPASPPTNPDGEGGSSEAADNRVEFEHFGQLLAKLESSERAFQANSRAAERQEGLHGSVVGYAFRHQAAALLFQPDPTRMPGIDRIEALVNEAYGSKLTAEAIRRLRGKLCRMLSCGTEQADKLSMQEAAVILESEGKSIHAGQQNPSPSADGIAMDLLLTWSGTPSHDIAAFFRTWLPQVVPGIQPWISSQDIAKGRKWADELTAQMSKTNISITFITPGNVRSAWVFYEIGFIAAKLNEATVCPYLIGVDVDLVKDTPIGQLQCTLANKEDTLRLILTINKELKGEGHNPQLIEGNFNSHWPKLKRQLDKLVSGSPAVVDAATQTEPSVEEQLSAEARQLLIEAAQDENGRVLFSKNLAGRQLFTNKKSMIPDNTPRQEAAWRAGLEQLVSFELLADVAYAGEIFRVTSEGYKIADLIASRRNT